MKISIPEFALVVLMGASGSGKSTFARQHFAPTEILSSDTCRGWVADDENDQSATNDAFDVLQYIAGKRLANMRLTVIDATNVQKEGRDALIALARRYHCLAVAIALDMPESLCHERNKDRPERSFGAHVVRQQRRHLRRSLKNLKREGFRSVYIVHSPEEVAEITVERRPLWNDLKQETGPFDIIGDVHGCGDELEQLLGKLGYEWQEEEQSESMTYQRVYSHPEGRKAIFVGDLVDRGPRSLDCLQLARNMVQAGTALCVPGNHDIKFMRYLQGRNVQINQGLETTVNELESIPLAHRARFKQEMSTFIKSLISHYMLDAGKLVVAHAGMKEGLQGRASGKVREFALYGETTGETDEYGLPIRLNWAADYRGKAMVVYGHTPIPEAEWLNHTINIDTGCVLGGNLTALRYPEREIVTVPALRAYYQSPRPFPPQVTRTLSLQQVNDNVLDIEDVLGKQIIHTRYRPRITIREENSIAALEVMSRFTVDPQWLIYLPPTMSPTQTSDLPDWLEHPHEAFRYYRKEGIETVMCQEKHMGSRAIVILCRDKGVVQRRFGIPNPREIGIIYTRTGRRFFNDNALEQALLQQLHTALTQTEFWTTLDTDWVCLDCELMPWSAKAQSLLQQQYAPVGVAGNIMLQEANNILAQAKTRGLPVNDLQQQYQTRHEMVTNYITAYQNYCWPVHDVTDLQLAPFHILATEDKVHINRTHKWHMRHLHNLAQVPDATSILATSHILVNVKDEESVAEGVTWWQQLTAQGSEGMVVKPLDFTVETKRGLVQPAIKCRGREYLRLIYGPEYLIPNNLQRLKQRGLGRKRSLALREFSLGVEALERFVKREPLRQVHACVFGILALESEPVDPRL